MATNRELEGQRKREEGRRKKEEEQRKHGETVFEFYLDLEFFQIFEEIKWGRIGNGTTGDNIFSRDDLFHRNFNLLSIDCVLIGMKIQLVQFVLIHCFVFCICFVTGGDDKNVTFSFTFESKVDF